MSTRPLHQLSASEIHLRVEHGSVTAREIVGAALARIREREKEIEAWAYLLDETDLDLEGGERSGPLGGAPVGIKDIFETRDMPTTWGTHYLRASGSIADAAAVALLRRAGATILGKTVSTEMAYFAPGSTRNPRDVTRTPGGSSSGSAAAVADCMVPLALGTQTAGSITRPASYCGIIGYKPTFGTVPTAGVKPFAPTLDTIGWFARSVADVALGFAALTASKDIPPLRRLPMRGLRIGVQALPANTPLDADVEQVLADTCHRLTAAGARVFDLELPRGYDDLVPAHKTIMAYEAARSLADEHDRYADQMSAHLAALLEEGIHMSRVLYTDALRQTDEHGHDLNHRLADVDVVLAPAASGEAPTGHGTTGDPLYSRAWTLLGLPSITLPLGRGRHGLPIGLQLIAAKHEDLRLLEVAQAVTDLAATEAAALFKDSP
ncbi:MAG: amidase [Halofilum sp. (in: g-proteobacteria)]